MPDGFTPVVSSHGNSKSGKPFFPTLPSTVNKIKRGSDAGGPKEVLSSVSKDVGGVLDASYPGALPRNEQQVSYYKHHSDGAKSSSDDANELYSVMVQAHLEHSGEDKFVRDIKAFPEPAVVVATTQQLEDIARFCTSPQESCVLTVDPTFCLGDFDVTPTTYRNLLLKCKRTGQHPVMVGPTMIHYTKTFSSYMFLASSIVGQCRDTEKVRVFGTDGERALIDAFSHEFPFALHLTCFNHVRRNIKDELSKLALPEDICTEILEDIFGKKVEATMYEGLVDCEDVSMFDEKFELVQAKWKQHSTHHANIEEFCLWLSRNKAETIRSSMLRPVREDAGLGSPPQAFYTNASESINNVIKRKVNYKRNDLPHFIQKLKELAQEQDREVERAIIGRGKYCFSREYEHLQIDESKWCSRMSRQQKEKHIKKVMCTPVTKAPATAAYSFNSQPQSCESLSAELHCLSIPLNMPHPALEGIGRKAAELLATDGAIVPAPGHSPDSRMVLSRTGKRPHLVTPKKSGAFSCDDQCPQYQSSKLCSHVVAVAEQAHRLSGLVSALQKEKNKGPNVSKLALTTMPRGRGRKGSRAPPKKRAAVDIQQRYELSSIQSLQQATVGQVTCASFFPSSVGGVMYNVPSTTYPEPSHCYVPTRPAYTSPSSAYLTPSYQGPSTPYSNPVTPWFHRPPEDPTAQGENPFKLVFIFGNISMCYGCHSKYNKDLGPPYDLCIQHGENRQYTQHGEQHSRFGNAYYHVNLDCVRRVWTSFTPSMLLIEPQLDQRFTDVHRAFLNNFLGMC